VNVFANRLIFDGVLKPTWRIMTIAKMMELNNLGMLSPSSDFCWQFSSL